MLLTSMKNVSPVLRRVCAVPAFRMYIQKRVLESASRLVKKGGRLVYATCSLLKRENQDVVEAFLAEHPGWRLVPVKEVFEQQGIHFEPGQLERFEGYMQLLPHVNNTDGFFAAVLQRDE